MSADCGTLVVRAPDPSGDVTATLDGLASPEPNVAEVAYTVDITPFGETVSHRVAASSSTSNTVRFEQVQAGETNICVDLANVTAV